MLWLDCSLWAQWAHPKSYLHAGRAISLIPVHFYSLLPVLSLDILLRKHIFLITHTHLFRTGGIQIIWRTYKNKTTPVLAMAYASPRIPLPIIALPRLKTDMPNEVLPSNCKYTETIDTSHTECMKTHVENQCSNLHQWNAWSFCHLCLIWTPGRRHSQFCRDWKHKTHSLYHTHEWKPPAGHLFSRGTGFFCKEESDLYLLFSHTSHSEYYWVHFPYKQCGEAIHQQAGAQSRKQHSQS